MVCSLTGKLQTSTSEKQSKTAFFQKTDTRNSQLHYVFTNRSFARKEYYTTELKARAGQKHKLTNLQHYFVIPTRCKINIVLFKLDDHLRL